MQVFLTSMKEANVKAGFPPGEKNLGLGFPFEAYRGLPSNAG